MNELCRLRPSASAEGRCRVDIRGQKALVNQGFFRGCRWGLIDYPLAAKTVI